MTGGRQGQPDERARYTLDLTEAEAAELRGLGASLRKKPARRRRETEDFTATVRRMLTGLAKRAEGDVDQLQALVELRDLVDEVIATHVRKARAVGASWAEIGDRLGITKQSAYERFGKRRVRSERKGSPDEELPFDGGA